MNIKEFNYCIVGFGNHSKTKLLPALNSLNKKIFGIASSKFINYQKYQIFNNLKDAIAQSNDKTIFVIVSPPKIHFSQTKLILETGRDIFVEKPIFTSVNEVSYISRILDYKKNFVTELLMYKYTKQYENFIKIWQKKKNNCLKIECFFNIPSIPENTFRTDNDILSSPLYDIGCYIISLFVDLNFSMKNIRLIDKKTVNDKLTQFYLAGKMNNCEIYSEFGVASEYKNYVKLSLNNDTTITFDKFFYGRSSQKSIMFKNKNTTRNIIIEDLNAFKKIFMLPKNYWIKNQHNRFDDLIKVHRKLKLFTKEIN